MDRCYLKNKHFTNVFNKLIKEQDIDKEIFCEVLQVSPSRFNAWRRGDFPSKKNLINICKILKIDPNQFLK